jgi:hypothetical protein
MAYGGIMQLRHTDKGMADKMWLAICDTPPVRITENYTESRGNAVHEVLSFFKGGIERILFDRNRWAKVHSSAKQLGFHSTMAECWIATLL